MRILCTLLLCFLGCSEATESEPIKETRRHTPRWAFEPWISKDISYGADTRAFIKGFQDRDIPVGVVVLDSPWETNYNTFVPNQVRYPAFREMVQEFRAQDIRTVLWVTQFINESSTDAEVGGDRYDDPSPTYLHAKKNGYFVNGGETYFWWKGFGASIDFFNPEAMKWWHSLQDPLLDMGIAGWKLDFGDSYVNTATVMTAAGPVPHQLYSEAYYEDFYEYGAQRVGTDEFLTMVRPYDKSYHFEGRFFARPEHAPIGWVGDNRRDWIGLSDALDHIFRSALAGYIVLGSDIGGYLDRDDLNLLSPVPFDPENFIRWTAMGAMTPFMQLHGRGNLEPWSIGGDEHTALVGYKYWAQLHSELVPFFYSAAEEGYLKKRSVTQPVETAPARWSGDYRFTVGDTFLVAPILDATARRDVLLPTGRQWYDWWALDTPPHEGGTVIRDYDVSGGYRIPLFVGAGAIIPLRPRGGVTEMGKAGSTVIMSFPAEGAQSYRWHDTEGLISVDQSLAGDVFTFKLSAVPSAMTVRIRRPKAPSGVQAGDRAARFTYANGFVEVEIPKGRTLTLRLDP